jgi:hypothetical protein
MEILAVVISITFCLFGAIGFIADWVAIYADNKQRGNK